MDRYLVVEIDGKKYIAQMLREVKPGEKFFQDLNDGKTYKKSEIVMYK